jgi:hypothetical protein
MPYIVYMISSLLFSSQIKIRHQTNGIRMAMVPRCVSSHVVIAQCITSCYHPLLSPMFLSNAIIIQCCPPKLSRHVIPKCYPNARPNAIPKCYHPMLASLVIIPGYLAMLSSLLSPQVISATGNQRHR